MSSQTQSFWGRLGATVGKAKLAAEIIGQARKHYGGSYISIGLRFLDMYARRFSPLEMVELDLLNVSKTRGDIAEVISKENLIQLQQSFNPVELTNQTENKLDFERLCADAGLPSARTVAVVRTSPRVSVSMNREEIGGGDVINALAARLPPGDYVIKPRDGALGRGVLVFSCGDTGPEHVGETLKAHLDRHGDFDSWLVQPKLVNHKEVTRISPSPALQTVRLVTYVADAGDVRILLVGWRLADAKAEFEAEYSNFGGTANNNVFCLIDPIDGTVRRCFMKSRHAFGFGLHEIEKHPTTGLSLRGVQPPMWNEIMDLGKKAALAFLPSRCLGWDIAVTSVGPVLIEANRYWDPHNEDSSEMQRVVRYLRAERARVSS